MKTTLLLDDESGPAKLMLRDIALLNGHCARLKRSPTATAIAGAIPVRAVSSRRSNRRRSFRFQHVPNRRGQGWAIFSGGSLHTS